VLLGDEPEPGTKVASTPECGTVTDRRHQSGGIEHAHARDRHQSPCGLVVASNGDKLAVECLDAAVQRLPFAADIDDQLSDAAADLIGRVGHQCVYCRLELASSLGKDVTTFEQDRPKLVQQRASDPN
jgi:hypothetical protein